MPPESSKAGERSRRVSRLLQKAVDGLPERERRAVLEHLFEAALSGGEALHIAPEGETLSEEGRERIEQGDRRERIEEALRSQSAGWLGRAALGPEQQVIPVRLSEEQHRRLKEWCAEHNFPMAVVIRGLVERFLDSQERRAA